MKTSNHSSNEKLSFILKPYIDDGMKILILSQKQLCEEVNKELKNNGHADDCDGFCLFDSKRILLSDTIQREDLDKVCLHEFIHMNRLQSLYATRPIGFVPKYLYNLFLTRYKGLGAFIKSGAARMSLLLIRWREEAICEMLSYFILNECCGIKPNDASTMIDNSFRKPTIMYLFSGGFNNDDLIEFKKIIYKECLDTLNFINNKLDEKKIITTNFQKFFEKEYLVSESTVKIIHEVKEVTELSKTFKELNKRTLF